MRLASVARSPFAAVLLLAASLFSAGCLGDADYRPIASGPAGVVTVVVDSTRWNDDVGDALRETLGQPIETLPVAEPAFDLRQVDLTPDNLGRVQRNKNIVFAAALNESSQEAEFLRQQFSGEAQKAIEDGGAVIARPNLWRRQQQVFYVAAATPEQLSETIRQRGAALRDSLNVATRRRTRGEMFESGRQVAIEDSLMQRHGFAVNAQHDYAVVTDTLFGESGAQGGLVLMVRKLPDTWRRLLVWYREDADPSTLSREWILSMRDSLAGQYLQGAVEGAAYTDRRRPINISEIDYLGRYGYETRGLWYMAVDAADGDSTRAPTIGGGGPFVNYSFYDQQQDRLYMIDGTIYAPDFDKREFLRQMEVIAYTFRTQSEAQQQAAAQ